MPHVVATIAPIALRVKGAADVMNRVPIKHTLGEFS